MDLNKILKISATAGKMILENGGETYRSEDIVARICETHGATADCFATLSGIMVAATKDNKTLSTVIRIKVRTINLEKVHQINELARNAENYNCDEFMMIKKYGDEGYSLDDEDLPYQNVGDDCVNRDTSEYDQFALPIGCADVSNVGRNEFGCNSTHWWYNHYSTSLICPLIYSVYNPYIIHMMMMMMIYRMCSRRWGI